MLRFQSNTQGSILPQVVVIEAGEENSTLVSEFSLQYSVSENGLMLSNNSIGEVIVDAPFENLNLVSKDIFFYDQWCHIMFFKGHSR